MSVHKVDFETRFRPFEPEHVWKFWRFHLSVARLREQSQDPLSSVMDGHLYGYVWDTIAVVIQPRKSRAFVIRWGRRL